jgi:predicted unusual protein kinase regulating ubiquinone biosynthesis (AarF/ABC1/UbiB family)
LCRYNSFDREPVAVGTIAQVHRATLLPRRGVDVEGVGRVVAVKVPKPHVETQLLADLSAMRRAAELCDALGLELGFDSVGGCTGQRSLNQMDP